jgi:hypothetical protein
MFGEKSGQKDRSQNDVSTISSESSTHQLETIMNKSNLFRTFVRSVVTAGIATTLICGPATLLWSADTPNNPPDNNKKAENPTDKTAQKPPDKKTETKAETKPDPKPEKKEEKKAEKKKLTGAELYQINCNRCHPERYATEFNSAQWKTIMTHMRVRANLPASQAKEILKYLQEDSGN